MSNNLMATGVVLNTISDTAKGEGVMQSQVILLKAKVDEYYATRSEATLFEVCALLSEVKQGALNEIESEFVNFIDVRIPAQS